jgi:hypothetical protein
MAEQHRYLEGVGAVMKRLLPIALLAGVLNSQGQNSPLRIEQVMTPQEYRETGMASPSVQQREPYLIIHRR